eukprot:1691337-Alexandrium_andersonii.AAC.1
MQEFLGPEARGPAPPAQFGDRRLPRILRPRQHFGRSGADSGRSRRGMRPRFGNGVMFGPRPS